MHHTTIPDAFTEITAPNPDTGQPSSHVFDVNKCSVPFSVSVVGLEYVNEENIAVTVLRAAFTEYDPATGLLKPDAVNATYQVYFLSTVTMALGSIPWERDVIVSAAAEGRLCPAMRRLPNVGSFFAEVLVSGIELVRKTLDIMIMVPVLVQVWGEQETCPLMTHGHTLMLKCGADLLSLDDFFDALNRANGHFWRAFSIVAERVRSAGVDKVANIIDGVAYYGESTVSPTTVYASFIRSVRVPVKELGVEMIQGVIPMGRRYVCGLIARLLTSTNPKACVTRSIYVHMQDT